MHKLVRRQVAVLLALAAFGGPGMTVAWSQDSLTVAVAQRGGWSTAVTELGTKQGFFAKRGLDVKVLYTQGSGEALQAVISGSVDVGVALGSLQVLGAFSRGAPIRIIGGAFTGANDILWYVPANSPIKTMKDANGHTLAHGSTGSSTDLAARSAVKELNLNAKLVQTGSYTATYTQVMSGQVDIGWMAPPVGLESVEAGKIRIIGSADQLNKFKDTTVRVIVSTQPVLDKKGASIAKFIQGYRDTLNWLYSGTDGVKLFSTVMGYPFDLSKRTRDEYFPIKQMSPDLVTGWAGTMEDGVTYRFIKAPLSSAQLQQLVQIPKPLN